MTVQSAPDLGVSAAGKRLVLLLAAAASAGYVCRVAITVVAPGIMRDFGLTQAQMGTVFSAFLIGYTIFQIPSGGLADHVSARRIFLVLCCGFALLTVLTAAVGWSVFGIGLIIPQLWLIRLIFGVIAAPTYPTSARTIAITIPARLQGAANSLVLASVGIGSAVTPVMLAPISARYGWRSALFLAAAISVGVALLWWIFGPQEHHQHQIAIEASDPARSASSATSSRPLRTASFWFLFASYLLQSYLGYIFIFWFYLYLVQVRHLEVLKAATFTALPWIATTFAIPLGGVFSDLAVTRWGATWGRRSLPIAALCMSGIFLVIGARTLNANMAVAALTICTVLVICTEGPFWATMTQLSGEHSGIAGGTMNFGGNIGGAISPALTPWLAERIGWETALTLTAALAVVAGLLWLGVRVNDANKD
jgi:MFS transporter, ACS family, glucarate transporter